MSIRQKTAMLKAINDEMFYVDTQITEYADKLEVLADLRARIIKARKITKKMMREWENLIPTAYDMVVMCKEGKREVGGKLQPS